MENLEINGNQATEGGENYEHSLRLTRRLVNQLRSSARLGTVLMVAVLSLVVLLALLTCYNFWRWAGYMTEDFYLFEGNNPQIIWGFATNIVTLCFVGLSAWEGWKAWSCLKHSADDDNALLEGTERLAKMLRWLTFWCVFYVGCELLERIWSVV